MSADFANRIASRTTGSGETYVAGSTLNSSSTYSMILTKYSSIGVALWSRTFEVNTAGNLFVGGMTIDANGNVVVTGSTYNGATNGYDLFVVKYNSSGTKQWHYLYSGAGNSYDGGTQVVCTSNRDVFVTGGVSQSALNLNVLTLKLSDNGAQFWAKTWDNVGLTDAGTTISLSDTSVVVTGLTQVSFNIWEYVALRYGNSAGTLLDSEVTEEEGTALDQANAVTLDSEGNIYLTGSMDSEDTGLDIKTIKIDRDLDIVWTATWEGIGDGDDLSRGIAVDDEGNVYVCGYGTAGAQTDAVLLKYDSEGNLIFAETHDTEGGDDAYSDLSTDVEGIFVGGYATIKGNRDFFVILYDTEGGQLWSGAYNGYQNKDEEIQQVTPDGEGNFIVSGKSGLTENTAGVLSVKYARHEMEIPKLAYTTESFTENRGQLADTDGEAEETVRYYTRSTYPEVFIANDKVSYVFAHIDTLPNTSDTMARLDLSFANPPAWAIPIAVGLERDSCFHNYYLGHMTEARERVPLERKVLQPNIYDNIDALYDLGGNGLFISLICKPGSDPNDIILHFTGATAISLLENGDLEIETPLESLILAKPTTAELDEESNTVSAAWEPEYVLGQNGNVSLSQGNFSSNTTGVVLIGTRKRPQEALQWWSTYYGWTQKDMQAAVEFDEERNIYTTGRSMSVDFPIGNFIVSPMGQSDITVNKFNFSGVPLWFVMIGGKDDIQCNSGSVDFREKAYDISVGAGDFLYVGGRAASAWPLDFLPATLLSYSNTTIGNTSGNVGSRGVILKFKKQSGDISWGTYFGDSNSDDEAVTTVEAMGAGGVAVAGYMHRAPKQTVSTWTNINPGGGALQQTFGPMFIATFNANNTRTWATQFGPEEEEANATNAPNDLVSYGSELFVTGVIHEDQAQYTDHFPSGPVITFSMGAAPDAFVAKFDESRALAWATYLGGGGDDWGSGVDCDALGNVYVFGTTSSTDFQTKAIGDALADDLTFGGISDNFIGKFSNGGAQIWARYFGGTGSDFSSNIQYGDSGSEPGGNGIAVDPSGAIFIAGSSTGDLPTQWPFPSPAWYFPDHNAAADAYMAAFSADLHLNLCSYYGSSATDHGYAIDVTETGGSKYAMVMAGRTRYSSSDYPTNAEVMNSYLRTAHSDEFDGVITKIYTNDLLPVSVQEPDRIIGHLVPFPNPCKEQLTVSLEKAWLGIGTLRLYDARGSVLRTIQNIRFSASSLDVPVADLPSGLYLLELRTEQGIFVGRFAKVSD